MTVEFKIHFDKQQPNIARSFKEVTLEPAKR